MDQIKQQYYHHENKNNTTLNSSTYDYYMDNICQFLKGVITKLVLSVSLLSLFFSLLHNFDFSISLPMKLVSHTLDKNCIFLLCNGLLVFLAKYSGFFTSSSSSSSSSKYVNNSSILNEYQYYSYKSTFEEDYPRHKMMMAMEADRDKVVVPLLEEEDHQESDQSSTRSGSSRSITHGEALENEQKHVEDEEATLIKPETTDHHLVEEEEEEEEDKLQGEEEAGWLLWEEIEEEAEEEEREGNGMLSTEELNKKFDDFIRKMKEELRIEAQGQQLVMV
ncbi:hypothetical protein ACOSQ3_030679 [Xanthoceras sorbifolium]